MEHTVEFGDGARLVLRGVGENGIADNCDLELLDSDGLRWSATVLTLDEVARLMRSYEDTGECQGGSFFACPDLLIVRDGTVSGVEGVIRALVASEDYRNELRQLDN